MFNFLKNMFSISKQPIEKKSEDSYLNELEELIDGFGYYANSEPINSEITKKGNEMLQRIEVIEKNITNTTDTNLVCILGLSFLTYSKWYLRGIEQKVYLEKCIKYLNNSILLSSENITAREKLGKLLIDEKLVRDLEKGKSILTKLNINNQLKPQFNSTLSKAKRQTTKTYKAPNSYNYCKFSDPSPAVFREERILFRTKIRQFKKEKKINELEIVLNQYYNLGVLVTLCYGNFDCNSATSGIEYENAKVIVKENCKKLKYSFLENGYISNSSFLSKTDWKNFDSTFGISDKKVVI